MNEQIEAIYEQGVLRPVHPIQLPEGARVRVIVLDRDTANAGRTPAEILSKIAALPEEGSLEQFSGRDHDAVLYPPRYA